MPDPKPRWIGSRDPLSTDFCNCLFNCLSAAYFSLIFHQIAYDKVWANGGPGETVVLLDMLRYNRGIQFVLYKYTINENTLVTLLP